MKSKLKKSLENLIVMILEDLIPYCKNNNITDAASVYEYLCDQYTDADEAEWSDYSIPLQRKAFGYITEVLLKVDPHFLEKVDYIFEFTFCNDVEEVQIDKLDQLEEDTWFFMDNLKVISCPNDTMEKARRDEQLLSPEWDHTILFKCCDGDIVLGEI